MSRLVLVLCLLFSLSAAAHSRLVSSAPADKAELADSPKEVVLTFAEPVTLTSVKLQASDGTKTTLSSLPDKPVAEAHVPLPTTLKSARYTVQWRATSDDGHVINGEFSFIVK